MPEITFENFDKFDRGPFAERLTQVITTFYPFHDESFVLSLNARFGSGKSAFIKMWENKLKADGFSTIYINAWKTDFDSEPIIPIVSSVLDFTNAGEGSPAKLRAALTGALAAVAIAGSQAVEHVTGINIKDAIDGAGEQLNDNDLKKLGDTIYKEFSFKKQAYEKLSEELQRYIEKLEKKPLVIFVDELDRAKPDYAVKFLEAIKHLFPIKGICFVLAVDRVQLEKSVKQIFGEIDFDNYYRRFVTREANLPEAVAADPSAFIKQLSQVYFDEKRSSGVSFPFNLDDQRNVIKTISIVSRAYSLSPREIEGLFRVFSQFAALKTQKDIRVRESWTDALLILIAMSIKQPQIYKAAGTGSLKVQVLNEHISKLYFDEVSGSGAKRYFIYAAMGAIIGLTEQEDRDAGEAVASLNVREGAGVEEGQIDSAVAHLYNIMGIHYRREKTVFQLLYRRLEEWKEFIE